MEFRLLGPFEVWDGATQVALGGVKQRCLLAALVLSANRVVPQETLIDALWPEDPPETAGNTLQVHVSNLRRLLAAHGGAEMLRTAPPGYRLDTPADSIDAHRFEVLTQQGREALQRDPEQAAALLREALAGWRGPALADLAGIPFAMAQSARLEELRMLALEDRIEADLMLGRHAELVAELEGLVAEHRLRERLHAQLMLALYRSDRQADALRVYGKVRTQLVEELGIDPGAQLRALEKAVLVQDPAIAWSGTRAAAVAHRALVGPEATLDVLTHRGRTLVPLEQHRLRVGRAGDNDLVLDGDGTVSRHHAELARGEQGWLVRDLGSSNGTFLNDQRIAAEQRLQSGDELRIGAARLVFRTVTGEDSTLQTSG